MSQPALFIHEAGGTRTVPLPFERHGVRIDWISGQWRVRAMAPGILLDGRALAGEAVLQQDDVVGADGVQLLWQVSAAGAVLGIHELPGNDTIAPFVPGQLPGEAVEAGVQQVRVLPVPPPMRPMPQARRFAGTAAARRTLVGVAAALLLLLVVGASRMVPVQMVLDPEEAQVDLSGLHWRWGTTLYAFGGEHRLEVRSPGYHDLRRTLQVDGALAAVPLQLTLQPLPGRLEIDTGGVPATVRVDGEERGMAPGVLELEAGTHEVLLSAPRYLDFSAEVAMEGRGREQRLEAALAPAWGWLEVDSQPQGAQLRVDGEVLGTVPQTVELDAGLHRVELAGTQRRGWQGEVAIEAGEVLSLGRVVLAAPVRVAAVESPEAPELAVAPAPAPPPPARLRSPLVGTLILVPAGRYRQGSDRREQGRRANEPLREVMITRPFYLAETEVTNGQFRTFRALHGSGVSGSHTLDLDGFAVSGVGWDDAVAFCNWLSEREGLAPAYERRDGRWQLLMPRTDGYRLPTEAEWEYAARYVDGQRWNRYSWGDALPPPDGVENLSGSESARGLSRRRAPAALPDYADDSPVVATVGTHGRTPLGFADMGGNVSEWMHDTYASLLPAGPVTDPQGAGGAGAHVVRGANWATAEVGALRLAWRDRADGPSQTVGFRVARSVKESP